MTRHYKKRRSWSEAEIKKLERLCERRSKGEKRAPSVLTFATKHRRTEGATRQMIPKLGFSLTG